MAVQVLLYTIPCDILPHQIGLRPRSPRPYRMNSNQTRGITARGYRMVLLWMPNVTEEEKLFRPNLDHPWGNQDTLPLPIKAGLLKSI